MLDKLKAIMRPTWWGFRHQNAVLVFAQFYQEMRIRSIDTSGMREMWELHRDKTRVARGIFRRSPTDNMTNSHDNICVAIPILSHAFDGGATAAEILDEGRKFGFYFSGKPEHGKRIDGSYLMLFRPEYRAYLKLACGRRLSIIETWALRLNLVLTKTKNILHSRILFLEELGIEGYYTEIAKKRIGDGYKDWYNTKHHNKDIASGSVLMWQLYNLPLKDINTLQSGQ